VPLTVQTSSIDDLDASNNSGIFSPRIAAGYPFPTIDQQSGKLAITVSAVPNDVAIGQAVELLVTVENLSNETLYNVSGFVPLLGDNFPNIPFTWNDPTRPGTLAPAGNGDASVATARIPYILPIGFPFGANRVIAVQAVDSDSTDGSLVVVRDTLTDAELRVIGPNVRTTFTADRTTARDGDVVTFTLTVINDATATDSAAGLTLTSNLFPDTRTIDDLAPGAQTTVTFTRPITPADIPQFTAQLRLTGRGLALPDITLSHSLSRTVSVPAPVVVPEPTTPIANIRVGAPGSVVMLPGRTTPLALTVTNSGNAPANNVVLRLAVPFGVEVAVLPANRVMEWALGTIPAGGSAGAIALVLTPDAALAIGTVLTLDATVSTSSDEAATGDNVSAIAARLELPAPTRVTLTPLTRTWLVADERDRISVQAAVFDQLDAPLPGVIASMSASAAGMTFTPSQLEFQDGRATTEVRASGGQGGTVTLAVTFANGASGVTTVNRRASAVSITRSAGTIGFGGSDRYNLFVVNTATLPDGTTASSDLVDLDIINLPAPLERAWFSFAQPTLPLGFGEFAETSFTVSIPAAANLEECAVREALVGTHTFTVIATGRTLGPVGQAEAQLTISAQAQSVTAIYPTDAARAGGDTILFTWRSNTPGTSTVYYRRQGESAFTPLLLSSDPAIDAQLYRATLDIAADPIGTVYEWYGEVAGQCATSTIAPPDGLYTFTRVRSTTFIDAGYDFTVADGYNLSTSVSGQPLSIRVRNDDTQAHAVLLDVENPYDDLILGFTGSGSVDQVVMLTPGQTFSAPLRVFTQHTEREVYELTLVLENDQGDIDRVPLIIRVQQPRVALAIQVLSVDPRTLVTTARLTNNGDTLTDLALDIVQQGTGIPANFVIQPDIQHTYLLAGQSLEIAFIPLDLQDAASPTPDNASGAQFDPLTGASLDTPTSLAPIPGPYVVTANARNTTIDQVPMSDGTLTNTCGVPSDPERTVAAECTTPAGSETRIANDWYCTNRPNIDVPIALALPNGGLGVPITNVSVGANFSPGSGTVYSHSTTVSLNGSVVGSAVVPTQSRIDGGVAPQALVLGGSTPTQTLNLRSTHTNDGHYSIASGFTVTVEYDEHTRTGCFTQAEVDASATSSGPLMCTPTLPAVAFAPDLDLELSLANGVNPNTLRIGDRVTVVAEITNAGTLDTSAPVVLTLNVPDGIAPVQVGVGSETLDLPDLLANFAGFLANLFGGGENELTLSAADDALDVGYSYTLEPLRAGGSQQFEFELAVVAEARGSFIVSGTAATQIDAEPDQMGSQLNGLDSAFQDGTNEDNSALTLNVEQCNVTTVAGGPWNIRANPIISDAAVPPAQPGASSVMLIGWHQNEAGDVFFLLSRTPNRWISSQAIAGDPRTGACPTLPYVNDDGSPFELTITKTVSPIIPITGETITYTITVENQTDESIADLTVADTLPVQLSNPVTSPAVAITETGEDRIAQWQIQTVETGDAVPLTLSGSAGSAVRGQLMTNLAQISVVVAESTVPITLSASAQAILVTCRQTTTQAIAIYAGREATTLVADVPTGTEIGVIGAFIDDPTWIRVTTVVGTASLIGWTNALPTAESCASDAFVDGNGLPIFVPTPTGMQCLIRLVNSENVFTIAQLTQITNSENLDSQNPGAVIPKGTLDAGTYALVTAIHPNRQYARVLYGVEYNGEIVLINAQVDPADWDDLWIHLREYDSPQFDQALFLNEDCAVPDSTNLKPARFDSLLAAGSNTLPNCLGGQSPQLINCHPAPACTSLFCGEPTYTLYPFGSRGGGCDNADPACDGTQDPCRAWAATDNRHCGWDLQTEIHILGGAEGVVYVLQDGIFFNFGSDNTYAIRSIDGNEVLEQQYTHVARNSVITRSVGEFIAEGIRLGQYGLFGRTDANFLHVHVVDKNLAYAATTGFNIAQDFAATSDPYTAPDIGTTAPPYMRLGEVRDITIEVGQPTNIHIIPRGLTNYSADIETDQDAYTLTLPPGLTLNSVTGIISGTATIEALTSSPGGSGYYTITFSAARTDGTTIVDRAGFYVIQG